MMFFKYKVKLNFPTKEGSHQMIEVFSEKNLESMIPEHVKKKDSFTNSQNI